MKNFILIIIAVAITFAYGEKASVSREPAVAGRFYPDNPAELEKMMGEFFAKANPPKTNGMVTALILPHAGYQFSGQVAAYGFKKLIGENIDTVILIGNAHSERFDGISIYPEGFFKTPLGRVEIDSMLAKAIMKESEKIYFKESPHLLEHSLEIELPFLQVALAKQALRLQSNVAAEAAKSFKIVPILFGNGPKNDYKLLAKAIVKNIKGKNILLIASSDLSHYPSYKDAKYSDDKVIKAILTGRTQNLENTIEELERQRLVNEVTCACGADAIKAVMEIEKELGANEIKLLNAANSGDVSKDQSRVVGYTAIGFFAERRGSLLNKVEQKKLLDIAKSTVESFITTGNAPKIKADEPMLNQRLGAFVTLREHGALRGCIGRFSPADVPLYQVVQQMAVSAAVQDHRFKPVTKDELNKLSYEISVLSPLERVPDPKEIVLGRDGVKIINGYNSGVFLPQVAEETGWDFDRFMGELCSQKAGLEPNCWKNKDTELYTFTAQVFGEEL